LNQASLPAQSPARLQQQLCEFQQHVTEYSPELSSSFKALSPACAAGRRIWVNKRFIYEALNDRRIVDASFRQQILYTVNQVESIYWACAGL